MQETTTKLVQTVLVAVASLRMVTFGAEICGVTLYNV